MKLHTFHARLHSACLALLLVSCSATRASMTRTPEELTQSLLIIQEESNGQVSHSWKRTDEFDLPPSHAAQLHDRARGPVVLVSDRQRDCDQEHIDCYRE